jgi:hypothetical protein
MIAMVASAKQCPICSGEVRISGILLGSVGVIQRHPSGPDITAVCDNCGYNFSFGSAEAGIMALFLLLVFAAPLAAVLLRLIILIPFILVSMFLVPWLFMRWFVKSSYSDKYFSRNIIKKATKMVKKGMTRNNWTGDEIKDLEKIRIYDHTDSWMTRYR